ncbi:MAG: hypothetical protein IIW03_04300 [Clostridia bacterium]|nr:hypothetical protein [Clostridia bacterium]
MKKITFILTLSLMFALIILSFAGCSREMTPDELEVKDLVMKAEILAVEDAEWVEYIETINNGYCDYSYYNVEAEKSGNYIAEVREGKNGRELYWTFSYEFGEKQELLKKMKEDRCSPNGYRSDAVEAGAMTYQEAVDLVK